MLGAKLRTHGSRVWLVNTGWTGGPYGIGSRMRLRHTRAMVRAALQGDLDAASYATDPVFGLAVPTNVADVPDDVLRPRDTWNSTADYDAQAKKLADMFRSNFTQFETHVSEAVRHAGPQV
jgi:phosphoenolpyruvate carboxykinase (ATP)